jgi:tetratricopeptide (TPR) repeat protein
VIDTRNSTCVGIVVSDGIVTPMPNAERTIPPSRNASIGCLAALERSKPRMKISSVVGKGGVLASMRLISLFAAVLMMSCVTADAEREYYEGRFDRAIALSPPELRAKYAAMKTFTMGGDWAPVMRLAAEAATSATGDAAKADALTWEAFTRYAHAMTSASDTYDAAIERADEALRLRRRIGEPRGLAEALFYRGLIAERQEDAAAARQLYNEALAIAEQNALQLEESYVQRHLGFLEKAAGNVVSARARLERSLHLREQLGFNVFLPFSLLSLAEVDTDTGDFSAAEGRFGQAAARARKLRFARTEVLIDLSWARLRVRQGRQVEARQLLVRALETSKRIGYQRGVLLAADRLAAADQR